ncbi:uncharacterized protein LOC142323247 [Lycorma delicatula]|uniref:uncharacterized protein LOC142323247 n=1 Tax=Lycorma delicatula TaxID=130591 RepID=UPI003F512D10
MSLPTTFLFQDPTTSTTSFHWCKLAFHSSSLAALVVHRKQLDDGTPATERTLEGCNVYFFQDLDNLHKVWNGFRKNIKTAGQLWIEMLRFYTEEFDFVHNVISIRTSRLVTKENKNFNTMNIAIEDPFNSSHNLGSALSMSMNIHILRQFQGARCHFGRLLPPPAPAENKLEEIFFDSYVPEGEPPNDRGCRICKVIGHLARDCSKNKQRHSRYKMKRGKNKKDENRERKINEENSCFRGSDNKPYKTDVTHKKNVHTKPNKPQACEESNEQTKVTRKELNKSQLHKSTSSSDAVTLTERNHDHPGFQQNKSTVMKNVQFNPTPPQNVSLPQKFIPPLLKSVTPGQFCSPRYCSNTPPPLIPQQFRFNNAPPQRLDNLRQYRGPGNSVMLSGSPLIQYHFGPTSVRPVGIPPFSHARSSNCPRPYIAVNDRSEYNMGPVPHSTMQIPSDRQTIRNNAVQHPERNSAVNGNVKQTNSIKKNRDLISK